MINECPLTINFNGIRVEALLSMDGACIVGDSGTGKTFLFNSLSLLQTVSPKDLHMCIEYRFPIDHVICINSGTPHAERLLFSESNSLVLIDNADIVFSRMDKCKIMPAEPGIRNVAFITTGRNWCLPRFSFVRYELEYVKEEKVFRFVRSKK